MEEPLPFDVLGRLSCDFGERADAVLARLLARRQIASADFLGDRLVRCIVHAACGDEQRVQQLLDLARMDYRDVIVAGEYDRAGQQVRDLRATFLLDTPEKFWAGELTCLLASRGYWLKAIETRRATAGPFEYMVDYSEGRATFIGPKGEMVIEKRDRQWLIHGNRRELLVHDLDHAFSDECAFRDAVSGYLLSNVQVIADAEDSRLSTAQVGMRPWWKFWI